MEMAEETRRKTIREIRELNGGSSYERKMSCLTHNTIGKGQRIFSLSLG